MKSLILCEGITDFTLLQYFMIEVYGWHECSPQERLPKNSLERSRTLKKGKNKLVIGSCGGCSKILSKLDKFLKQNKWAVNSEEFFDKFVIVTDRDELSTEKEFIESLDDKLQEYDIELEQKIENDKWISYSYINDIGESHDSEILLLMIPFEDTGAMETFLLNTIKSKDYYDGQIIDKGNEFVDHIDKEKRYLKHRRDITKAKFDVYFSVRTSATQFGERQNILRGIEWKEYLSIQKCFNKLKDLE